MGRRTLLLVAALVVAALGTTMVFLYVNGVDERARGRLRPRRGPGRHAPIAAGRRRRTPRTPARSSSAVHREQRRGAAGALSDISAIADQVALAPIAAGSADHRRQFGEPGESTVLPDPRRQARRQPPARRPGAGRRLRRARLQRRVFLTVGPAADRQRITRVLLPVVPVIAAGSHHAGVVRRPRPAARKCTRPCSRSRSTRRKRRSSSSPSGTATITFGLLNDESEVDRQRSRHHRTEPVRLT